MSNVPDNSYDGGPYIERMQDKLDKQREKLDTLISEFKSLERLDVPYDDTRMLALVTQVRESQDMIFSLLKRIAFVEQHAP